MGNHLSRLFRSNRKYRILLVGLNSAGKSSILYKLKLGEVVTTVPTIGFCLENVVHKEISLDSFDVGGRCHIRPLMKYFFQGTDALVFVVDSTDVEMFEEAKQEMGIALEYESLANCPVLILANKQDLPSARSVAMVTNELDLNSIKQEWAIYPSSISDLPGMMDAFDWLSTRLELRDFKTACVTPVVDTVSDVQDTITKSKMSFSDFFKKPLGTMKLWLS